LTHAFSPQRAGALFARYEFFEQAT